MKTRRPRICYDRILPSDHHAPLEALYRGLLDAEGGPIANSNLLNPDDVVGRLRMAAVRLKKWKSGSTLNCTFLDGSAVQRSRVLAKAKLWERYANIRLNFDPAPTAEIRISFQADDGSWSAVGKDALIETYFPRHQPTMNFGWLEDDTDEQEYERVVLHEFGHALGCIHEHQSPSANLKWDERAVMEYFTGPPNFWTEEQIRRNVLDKYGRRGMQFSRFDAKSIMLYMFPGELFLDHRPTASNTTLSPLDEQFIGKLYPPPSAAGRESPPEWSLGEERTRRGEKPGAVALSPHDRDLLEVIVNGLALALQHNPRSGERDTRANGDQDRP